jgi:hypothetical protein
MLRVFTENVAGENRRKTFNVIGKNSAPGKTTGPDHARNA